MPEGAATSTAPTIAELVEEFLSMTDEAAFWAEAQGLAVVADNALDDRSPDDLQELPAEVLELMESSQWHEWMWGREQTAQACDS